MAEEDEEIQDILNSSADFFANSSAETVAESVFPPPPVISCDNDKLVLSPNSNAMFNEFISESSNPNRICCPFCIFDFGFEYILKEHIKESHPNELRHVLSDKNGDIGFYKCPFCEAKFYHKELLPRHVTRKHEICVLNMFSGFGCPEKYVYCRFCPHKILRKHYKLLIIHIEKKHFPLFEKYIIDKYSNFIKGCSDSAVESPGISFHMTKLTTKDSSCDSPKSILKPRTAYPIEDNEVVDNIMLETEVNVLYANFEVKPNETKKTRRKLRFNLPDEDDDKENIVSPPKKQKLNDTKGLKWLNLLKSKKQQEEDVDATRLAHFKCGICSEGFSKNSKLSDHIKKKHKGISLQAQYCCGDCDAKFYKNSYLKRHSKYHHSPRCLQSTFIKGKF